jgi:sigma-E factor negative regulatory protein RseB
MYLAHTVRDGNEREHLVSLTGNAREVIRDNNAVVCIVPGSDATKVDKRPAGRRFSPIVPIRPEKLARYYRFELAGTERVAGREAQMVIIAPADDLRYGYRLLLDSEHYLPLGASTFDEGGEQISQILFTELKVGAAVSAPPPSLVAQSDMTRTVQARKPLQNTLTPRWSFSDKPPGFELSMHRRRLMGPEDHEVEHFVFSDGLASVSVYIEEALPEEAFDGVSQMGGVIAIGRRLKEHQATAVGEVPRRTLEHFLSGIRAEHGVP